MMVWQNKTGYSALQRQAETQPCVGMLVDVVADVAKNVLEQLGGGLPKSVYQLMLCQQLAALGIVLESERLLHAGSDAGFDIIVLDRCVSIACLASASSQQAIQACQLALSSSEYAMALVIDFSEQLNLYPVNAGALLAQRH